MARCKYCGAEISRLDKDNCPFCGGRKPLEGIDSSTQDMTKALEDLKDLDDLPAQKSKKLAAFLAIVGGVFGLHEFYLGKAKIALLYIALSLIWIGGVGSLLFFSVFPNPFAYLIPFFVWEAILIVVGILIYVRPDIIDSRGGFLK